MGTRSSKRRAFRRERQSWRRGDKPTLAIVLDHPVQHFSPVFRELEAAGTVRSMVFYRRVPAAGYYDPGFARVVEWDIDLLSGYEWWSPPPRARGAAAAGALWRAVRRAGPDAVMCFGWARSAERLLILWALVTRRPLFLYSDTTWQHERRVPKHAVRGGLLRLLALAGARAISTGTFNREFYIRHGIHPSCVFEGVCPADIDLYEAARGNKPSGTSFRIGYAGKLIPRKGVDELLRGLSHLEGDWTALIAGDGPERSRLESLAHNLDITERLSFLGFLNQSDMPWFLAGCDVLVVPSIEDMRVLIVVEAMAAGTPVIVSSSTAVWGPGDIVEHGVTGLVYPSGEVHALSACLESIWHDSSLRARLRDTATERLPRLTPAALARQVEAAVRSRPPG